MADLSNKAASPSCWRLGILTSQLAFCCLPMAVFAAMLAGASNAGAVEIIFKNGTNIVVPEAGINIVDYQGGYDTQMVAGGVPNVFPSASTSNYGGGGLMSSNKGSAMSMIRFDVSALAGKFTAINSVKLRLYPRNNAVGGSTIAYRVSDLNSNWIEGDHYGSFTCCPGNASGGNWNSSVANASFGGPALWAGGIAGAVLPYTDFDSDGTNVVAGVKSGLGLTANSAAVLNAIDGTGTPIGVATPFDIDLNAQPTSGGGALGGTTASLTELITDWASSTSADWFERTGFDAGWYATNMPWLSTCANNGFEDGCTPVVANEGLMLKGTTTADTMQFWTGDGSNWGAANDPFGVGGATPVVYRPELVIDFDPIPSCIIGDANCDGYVDISGDILPGFSNFTGPGSFGKTRAQGDVEGSGTGATTTLDPHDGDVDVSDLLTMFGNFTGPPPDESAPGEGGLGAAEVGDPSIPDLIYDAATGEVTLDVDGSGIIGYVLKNGAGTFVPGNHTPILGGVTTSLVGELSEAALSSPGGANSIGFVFPTGMDLATLSAYLTTNEVSRSLGAPIVPFDLVVIGGVTVPEPATLVLAVLGLAGMGLVAYRRRRAA